MNIPKIPLAQTIIQHCKAKGIAHIIISPGSRNAPLTIGFTGDPFFKCYSIVDERCAAFFALGIAQQIKHPVALVCTSGSALLNYFPAIAEAYYSDIPLVVLSADRPSHLVDIGDGQTINQTGVYGSHVVYATHLSEEVSNACEEDINTALNMAINQKGPVHINCPFNEPLYETVDDYTLTVDATNRTLEVHGLDPKVFNSLINTWSVSKKIMVLVGVNTPNSISQKILNQLAEYDSVLVFTETTSNLHHERFLPNIDQLIAPLNDAGFKALQPDLLVTFGGMVVSKKIKAFLRNYAPKHHWHIDEKRANNTFFCLDLHIEQPPEKFFRSFLPRINKTKSSYNQEFNKLRLYRKERHNAYLETISFSDFKVFNSVLQTIPEKSNLHLGNSSTVRYTQLFDLNKSLNVFCNRGTSGIDGSTSTAIGGAHSSENRTVFITGDLSFLYDSNALWNHYIPKDFRIIVINNDGGGIFRILPGHKDSENFDTYFETVHGLNAVHLCRMYDIGYESASSQLDLESKLKSFYDTSEKPRLLEIFTPRTDNDKILLQYFDYIK